MLKCPVCAEISERSRTYGRWLVNENYADSATLLRVIGARGLCSAHARHLLDADALAAAAVARTTLRTIAHELRSQLAGARGYRDALDPREPCPWCAIERMALDAAIDVHGNSCELCWPHARAAATPARARRAVPESPQPPCPPLPAPEARPSGAPASWWSPSIDELWEALRVSCPSCAAAYEAEAKRKAFLQRGPVSGEHWDAPVLCVAHDAALGWPRDTAFARAPGDTARECACCAVGRRAAEQTANIAAIALANAAFCNAYAHVDGFCLPHTRAIVAAAPERSVRDALARCALERIETLVWELDETSARGSWMLRDQGTGNFAANLPQRAWWLLAGGTQHPYSQGERP